VETKGCQSPFLTGLKKPLKSLILSALQIKHTNWNANGRARFSRAPFKTAAKGFRCIYLVDVTVPDGLGAAHGAD